MCDGGLLIDLSGMRSVAHRPGGHGGARVEPGAPSGDFDAEAQAFGLATPLGINSTTGVAGLTLGAGFGWFSRKHGMTIDNLRAVDVITADGTVSSQPMTGEHADLFWALRGGSGNFGVVTRFEFRLHPLGPDVLTGLVVYPLSEAASALKQYREYVKKLGDETDRVVGTAQGPAAAVSSAEGALHGDHRVRACSMPAIRRPGRRPSNRCGTSARRWANSSAVQPYRNWQKTFDPLLTPGARNYWKSHNFADLSDGAIDITVKYVANLPSPHCEIFFGRIGGATMRPAPDATAYSHRNAMYVCNVHGRWETAAEDKACIEWARGFFRDSAPHATGGVYVNFLTDDEADRVKAAYGPNYDRLVGDQEEVRSEEPVPNQSEHPSRPVRRSGRNSLV